MLCSATTPRTPAELPKAALMWPHLSTAPLHPSQVISRPNVGLKGLHASTSCHTLAASTLQLEKMAIL